ncbi:hypothetical protein V1Y59_07080 [Gordonia sp. PKS22-38]|uniref:Uncharacterized protein n=1 Tax=Gordonia prachuapensis TaxID=3115651 RepID=A0ABU7MR85_9ACTN|nr:hypothetical protein [Gordonia sp. PKS22-38]
MLASVVFVPSAPLLVPALAGPDAVDTEPVRAATLAAGRELAGAATTWMAVGARDPATTQVGRAGTLAAYGVDVPVTLDGAETRGTGPGLPLSMLIAGWLRAEAGTGDEPVTVEPVTVAPDASPADCADVASQLRDRVDQDSTPVGVLVVADGSTALSARAPGGGLRPEAVELQQRIDEAIGSADTAALAALTVDECSEAGVGGRPAWQVAAGLCAGRTLTAQVTYRAAPFGVGYVVATWTPR